ncbi:MAG: DUF2007 domain-containing protein [Muribaculaceae bacterium]|nr:DUF2007 domain-containing protein [Muribaculaceae bacterium]
MKDRGESPVTGWVTVESYQHDWQAGMAQSILKDHDIPCVLGNQEFASIYPIGFNSLGAISVSVPEAFAEQARELLKNLR